MRRLALQANRECFFCGQREGLHEHHVFGGTANRKKSDKYGLTVWLCPAHHNMSSKGVHMNRKQDLILKRYAQKIFEEEYGHDEFMRIFHRNYLEGDEDGN